MDRTTDQPVYHVVLAGRTMGPYDRRTIVGLRIKNTLTGEHLLIGADGSQATVDELIGRAPVKHFQDDRGSIFSLVHATFCASVLAIEGKGIRIPRFRGEIEARVQADVLRIAGRFREGLGWKEGRIKIPLKDIVHARINNTQVDLWLRPAQPGAALQRLSLELFTHDAAGELVDWFHDATPWPASAADGAMSTGNVKALLLTGARLAFAMMVLASLIAVAILRVRA